MPDEYDHLRESADKQTSEDFLGAMQHIFGADNVFAIGFEDDDDPEFEELDADDWKVLFMVLCENRGGINLEQGLTDYGKGLLHNVQRKIGINAVGVDISATPRNSRPMNEDAHLEMDYEDRFTVDGD